MKICFNSFNIPSFQRTYGFDKKNPILKTDVLSFRGKVETVTKVNLIDSESRDNIEADLIEGHFNGAKMRHEIKVNGERAGYADISVSPKIAEVPYLYKNGGFLYVSYMENTSNGKYKGVGRELLKSAVKRSDEFGFDGRVALRASKNAHTFHYKFGFEPIEKGREGREIRRVLDRELKKDFPHTEFLGPVDMYLPSRKIDEILCK